MDFITANILTIVTFTPAVGAVLLLFHNRDHVRSIRAFALIITILAFVFSLHLIAHFDSRNPDLQFALKVPWIPSYGIDYSMGIDGISLFLVLLTTLLTPLAILASWSVHDRLKEYFIFMLLLETGMIGVFVSLDLFLFYVFWEIMLVPMYFLIGVWGGERRIYAAIKFVLYTMIGSVLMLVAIIALYFMHGDATGMFTFSYPQIQSAIASGRMVLSPNIERLLFLAFFLAFAVKVPLFPFHTWLPDAHVEAPTAGSVLLAGVLLKMGTYGLLRFNLPLFPQMSHLFAPLISLLAIVGIIYGALVAMVQPDMKKLVAYSSVSHLGFIVLGIFSFTPQGVQGAVYQMLNHGVSTGALFLLVGVIYDRRHTRLIDEFGGLANRMPLFAAFFLIVTLSSIGLPGLNGFVGEFLILLGTFGMNPMRAAVAAVGVILSAVYMLWMYQRVIWGEIKNERNAGLPDLAGRERAMLIPLLIVILWMGIYSNHFLRPMDASVAKLVNQAQSGRVEFARTPEPRGGETTLAMGGWSTVEARTFPFLSRTVARQVEQVRGEENSPPWIRRGGRDLKKIVANPACGEPTGWFVQTTDNRWLERPAASERSNVASRNPAGTRPYSRTRIYLPSDSPGPKVFSPLRGCEVR
jgi:NADH-quinone oxidoreductase subunit M